MSREIEAAIFEALAHPARRDVIRLVAYGENGTSYTEILTELRLSTGRLNYHLKQLDGFIEKDERLRYHLTPLGERAMDLVNSLEKEDQNKLKEYVKTTTKPSLMPTLKAIIIIQMVVVLAPIVVVSNLLYIEITTGGSVEQMLILTFFLGVAIALFLWLGYAIKNVPGFLKVLERRIYD
ncbi:MAG: winged helix-turn-helix domain-containing protein [Candidatus Thorarchaeota archaeon]